MRDSLAAMLEGRRNQVILNMLRGGPDGDFTHLEGRSRIGHLHVLKHMGYCCLSLHLFSCLRQLAVKSSTWDPSKGKKIDGPGVLMNLLADGHVVMFFSVISSNFSSALILEDDADWDVAIREQTPAIANALRDLTDGVFGPWGFRWDYLVLGHCGGGIVRDYAYRLIKDPTTAPAKDHIALWPPGRLLRNKTRFVHQTSGAVCAFGYAVSRHGAKKLIEHISRPGLPLDIDYAHFCKSGAINCFAVTPEIIHHHRWTGHKTVSDGPSHGALEPGETEQKFTINIKHSARCNSDPDVLRAYPARTQGELIQCLPTGIPKRKYVT
ncbi:hypothetical protein MMC07_003927 [Pseudocyphellaria aurata]|nr:hypothetical protein [Pseudocyphellaria aurata]